MSHVVLLADDDAAIRTVVREALRRAEVPVPTHAVHAPAPVASKPEPSLPDGVRGQGV